MRDRSQADLPDEASSEAIDDAPSRLLIDERPNRHHPFYALSFRNFRLFFIGQLISVAGTWMQSVGQQWLVWSLTHSAAWLGIISGASALPYVVFAMWGGQVADRYSRRAILVWTQTVSMILAFILAILATNRWVPVQAWHVAILAAILGVVNAFNMPAQQAFVTDMVDERDAMSNAIALNSLRFNLARFIGPVLAGIVLVKLGTAGCFALNGVSFIAVIISLMMMRLPKFMPHHKILPMWEGFGYIWMTRSVFRTVALVGAASLLAWSASTLYPIFGAKFASSPIQAKIYFNAIFSLNGVGAAIGAFLVAMLSYSSSRRAQIYGGAILFSAALFFFGSARSYHLALAFITLAGFAMIIFATGANTKVQEEVPDDLRGRVMAVYSLVFAGLNPIGGLEIGFLAERLNAANAVRINSTLCLLIALALLLWSQLDSRRAVYRGS